MATPHDWVRGIKYGARAMASALPDLIAGILSLNLIAVSLIYTLALILEFWNRPKSLLLCILIALIAFSGLLFAVLALSNFRKGWRGYWADDQAPDLGSVWACAAPAAIAILGTAIIGLWDPSRFHFNEPLLHETAYQAGRFVCWIKHL
jgi:hypothetical protein